MRVLGIDTATQRGSVALVESGGLVAHRAHQELNAHAERLLPLVEEVFAEAGWARDSLDRIAVGIGPGSFTGVRVGMALAQGIALGLGVEVLGVPSLAAMARAVPATVPGRRLACLDARREELFVALFAPPSTESPGRAATPRVVSRGEMARLVEQLASEGPLVLLGAVLDELDLGADVRWPGARWPDTRWPDARWIADLAEQGLAEPGVLEPLYVRDPDAVKPAVPPDALARELGASGLFLGGDGHS